MPPPTELHATGLASQAPQEAEQPLIDHRAMRDWCEDLDQADVLALLARVPAEAHTCIAGIRKAIGEGDLAAARRCAHRLKGMASNLGAARLAQTSRGIERESHSIDDATDRLALLEKTLGETLEALRACS